MGIVPVALAFTLLQPLRLFGEDKGDGGYIWGDVCGDEHNESLLRKYECSILCPQ